MSFWLQALTRVGLSVGGHADERAYWYLVRLLAFLLIVAAIAMKNLGTEAGRDPED